MYIHGKSIKQTWQYIKHKCLHIRGLYPETDNFQNSLKTAKKTVTVRQLQQNATHWVTL